jgi:hypothetical protein
MKKGYLLLAAFLAVLLAGCSKPQTAWITSVDSAKADAAKYRKDTLIVFTGSDWNDPSKDMITKVFTPEFFKKASRHFVLCNIDIVQDEKLMDKALLETNYTIATEYGVQTLPSFMLLTPQGDVYATGTPTDKTGTLEGFMAYLDTFKDARKKIVDLRKKIDASKGSDKATAIDQFLEAIPPVQRTNYGDFIRQVPELDKDGKAGLKGKYQFQTAWLEANELFKEKKFQEAGDYFVKFVENNTLEPSQAQQSLFMGAYLYAMTGAVDNAKIIALLEKAIAADPQSADVQQIKATIEQIKATPDNKAAKK